MNILTNLIHDKIREFRIDKFEDDIQEVSHSGISLLSFLGKIYKKILLERLKKVFFTNDLIPD